MLNKKNLNGYEYFSHHFLKIVTSIKLNNNEAAITTARLISIPIFSVLITFLITYWRINDNIFFGDIVEYVIATIIFFIMTQFLLKKSVLKKLKLIDGTDDDGIIKNLNQEYFAKLVNEIIYAYNILESLSKEKNNIKKEILISESFEYIKAFLLDIDSLCLNNKQKNKIGNIESTRIMHLVDLIEDSLKFEHLKESQIDYIKLKVSKVHKCLTKQSIQ